MGILQKEPHHQVMCIHCDEGWVAVPDGHGCIDWDHCFDCKGTGFVNITSDHLADHIWNMMTLYYHSRQQLDKICDFPLGVREDNPEFKQAVEEYDSQMISIESAFKRMGLKCPFEYKCKSTKQAEGGVNA